MCSTISKHSVKIKTKLNLKKKWNALNVNYLSSAILSAQNIKNSVYSKHLHIFFIVIKISNHAFANKVISTPRPSFIMSHKPGAQCIIRLTSQLLLFRDV